jgi:DUF4097 and DUF4098 domain-containing protein YvlB
MSKGHGKVVFSKNKIVEINVSAGDLLLKKSNEDNVVYFDTDDSFFTLESYENEFGIHIDVGKANLKTGFFSSLNDITIKIPANTKLRINLSSGDLEAKDLLLDLMEVSIKSGDASLKNLKCNKTKLALINGDLFLEAETNILTVDCTKGDMSLYIKNDPERITLNSLLGDVLLKLEKEPKVVESSVVLGDFSINGKNLERIEGSGKCEVFLSLENGDADVVFPVISVPNKEKDNDGMEKILEMLRDGKINKDEASKLIDSINLKKEVF